MQKYPGTEFSLEFTANYARVKVNGKYVTTLSVTLKYTIDYTDPSLPPAAVVPEYSPLVTKVGIVVLSIMGVAIVVAAAPADFAIAAITGFAGLVGSLISYFNNN